MEDQNLATHDRKIAPTAAQTDRGLCLASPGRTTSIECKMQTIQRDSLNV